MEKKDDDDVADGMRRVGIAEVYALLVAHGHRLDDIRERYTEEQVSLFYFLAGERERERAQLVAHALIPVVSTRPLLT